MRGFVKVTAIGNVGRDPEIRHTQAGDPIASFSIAANEQWKSKSGEKQERTEWLNCSVFGKLAQIVRDYVKKGTPIYLEGKLQTEEWEDKDGNKRKTTKCVIDGFGGRIQLLGGKDEGGGTSKERVDKAMDAYAKSQQPEGEFQASDDDVPF